MTLCPLSPTNPPPMPRPRHLIVDAYNVLHVTGVLSPEHAGPDLVGLAELIAQSRFATIRTTLVCDGAAEERFKLPARIDVHFAGKGQDADSHIESILARDSAPRTLRVISSDRRLRIAARKRKAGWMASDEFLRCLNLDAGRGRRVGAPLVKPDSPLDETGVQRWLHRFGVDDDDALRRIQSSAGQDDRHRSESAGAEGDQSPLPHVEHDPAIEQALQEWRDQLSPDDLEMSRWISGVEPIRKPDEPHS